MESRIAKIEQEVQEIKRRNQKVEADKAWETSFFRVVSIVAITYLIAALVMYMIGVANYWQNALIPVVGYFLSTQSLPIIKKWWIENRWGK
jgi:ABC-type anion transport system duplicated permease subunit